MTDIYGEPVQIARPLRENEILPQYSTMAIFYGCAPSYRKADPMKKSVSRAAEFRMGRAEGDYDQHGVHIAAMLKEYKTNTEIGKMLGISSDRITNAIGVSDELRALSIKRRAITGAKGGGKTAESSRLRFMRNKKTILADIAESTLGRAAKKWSFDPRTLLKYTEEEKNAQS